MQGLFGRVAFITGAGSGIGLGIAQACHAAGMRLVLTDVDGAALNSAERDLRQAGAETQALTLDVADEAQWQQAAQAAERHFGAIHLLCNNAGITGSGRHVAELDPDEWRRVLDINLGGAFLGTRSLLPALRRHGDGAHIVNTASMGGLLPYAGGSAYVASKAALLAFSEALREELTNEPIGVSVLLPAQVRTRLFETSARELPGDGRRIHALRAQAERSLAQDGLDPFAVGQQVLRAVREGRFHIVTHPALADALRQKTHALLKAFDAP